MKKLLSPIALLITTNVSTSTQASPSFDELKTTVSEQNAPLVELGSNFSNINSDAGKSLQAEPPVWKTISLSNSGKGWQRWSGDAVMILMNDVMYPSPKSTLKIGTSACYIQLNKNSAYGCLIQQSGTSTTTYSWSSVGTCQPGSGSAGATGDACKEYGKAVRGDPNYRLGACNALPPIPGRPFAVRFCWVEKRTAHTTTTPGKYIDNRIKSLHVLIEQN